MTPHDLRAAFETLVPRLRPSWIRFARGLVGEDDAEELVQRAIAMSWKALQKECGMDSTAEVAAYIRTTIHNLAQNATRDAVRRRTLDLEHHDEIVEKCTGTVTGPWGELSAKERKVEVETMLQDLPPSEARALRLFFLEELEGHEVAERTGWTIGTTRTLRARALGRLRELHGMEGNP